MSKGTRQNLTTKNKAKATVKTKASTLTTKAPSNTNIIKGRVPRLKCKTVKQKELSKLITEKEIVIASGPAGTGKSYISIAKAIELVRDSTTPYKKIIISKPAIEAEEKHGFLPGDMKEKMEPYVASSVDIIDKIIGETNRKKLVEDGVIIIEALAYIRGKSIDKSILVMEEVQNMSPSQTKTLLTRIGSDSKFILSGDIDQSDKYKKVEDSGLFDLMKRHKNIDEIGFMEFDEDDIVRNPIITKILKNYKNNPMDKPKVRILPRKKSIKPTYVHKETWVNLLKNKIKNIFK